ncbi:hypothetical protein [Sphingobacterium multivorum]|uniref:hypothetical protein n=1 Tax=Sphingobacterium multivorum TaxID=28454 RepID=UPI0028B126E7|nr:hypothetical protein [Sphingobacterium multivorum]
MPRNYAQFFAICKAVDKDKNEVVLEFTDGRTDRLSDLSNGEWKELELTVRKWQKPRKPNIVIPGDLLRKKLIAIAGKMNWGNDILEIVGRLNQWCQTNYHKELNELDVDTLNKAVWVMENKVYSQYLKSI